MPRTWPPIEQLPHLPASDVKKRGWRDVIRTMRERGAVLVTNHDEPEAVILSVKEYAGFLEVVDHLESQKVSELEKLRRQFDLRLAALRTPDAGARLRSVMRGPAKLRGKVKAGSGY